MSSALERYSIPGWHGVYYVPDFISDEEEQYIIRKIKATPQPQWKQLANRRLQLLGGEITSKNILVSRPMPAYVKSFPNIIQRLSDTGVFKTSPHGRPNHIILNEYLPGQGIMPHEDGPAYHPVVATISLGSHSVFHYYAYNQEEQRDGRTISATPVLSVLLEPRSAVITTDSLYEEYLHGIEPIDVDRVQVRSNSIPYFVDTGTPVQNWEALTSAHIREVVRNGGELRRATRYSLTCRDVAKVRKTPL